MKWFIKLFLISAFSLLLLLPKKISWACGPWPAPPEEFRLSFFKPTIGDNANEFAAYYFSIQRYFKSEDFGTFATQIETDQNYIEWHNAVNGNFSKQDFYNAINEYSYQLISDSANNLSLSNSFLRALLTKRNNEYFEYFKLAKSSERFNDVSAAQDVWGLDPLGDKNTLILVNQLQSLLKATHSNFIKQRAAYVLCRLFFYRKDLNKFNETYTQYLQDASTDSWVKPSAFYYHTIINNKGANNDNYYKGLIKVIDHSKDKRMACIKLITGDTLQNILNHLSTNHEKAVVFAAFAARYPAYSLSKIKHIYSLDPHNNLIPLLITREVNKLEDWLLTPVLTDYKTSALKENWEYGEDKSFEKQNIKSDRDYATNFKNFLVEISKKGDIEKPLLSISLCHVSLLLKDTLAARQYCERAIAESDKNSSIYIQAMIDNVAIQLQQKHKLDKELKENIYSLLVDLDYKAAFYEKSGITKLKATNYYKDIKDALLVYLGRSVLKMGDVANAALILSGTDKPWGEYRTGNTKSAYFILNEYAKEEDFEKMLHILRNKNKSSFENYFCKTKCEFYGNYGTGDHYDYDNYGQKQNTTYFWKINKVLDLEGTYFLNNDSLEKALAAFKQVPNSFWVDSANVYDFYLTGNPFKLNIYDPAENKVDSTFKNDPNKAHFIAKLIEYKRKESIETNPETKAKLNFIIGNAYYSMSFFGKFWLMSKLWWSRFERDGEDEPSKPNESSFNKKYYETTTAKSYYQKAFTLTKNPKKAAFYCMYLTMCENNRRCFKWILAPKKENDDYQYKANDFIYTSFLQKRKGSEDFYNRLINECPLYTDFRKNL